jgi:DNA-binding response OmpR family regulator
MIDSGPFIKKIERLEDDLEIARDRVKELEQALGIGDDIMPLRLLGLTPMQARLVNLLWKRDTVTRDQILIVLYQDDYERRFDVQSRIVDVICCQARKRLRKHGITLGSLFKPGMRSDGGGYRMPPESKEKLTAVLGALKAPVEACETRGLPADRQRAAE